MPSIADKYHRRAQSVGRETARLRGDVAKLLNQGLRDATQEQLYDRTPLPVTRDMMNSIRPQLRGNTVQVGYSYGRGARYAKYRLNMKGISRSGGHRLDMQPSAFIQKNVEPQIKRATRAAQRKIIGG